MAQVSFDGTARLVTIGYDAPITSISATAIYSAWKNWVVADHAQFPPAFGESVGGNELTATTELAGYFFLRNDLGWRLAPVPQDYEIRISGDLYPFDPATPWLVGSGSAHAVQFVLQRSAASLVTPGGDPEVIAQAVWDRSMALHSIVGSFGKRMRSLFPRSYGI
jgi:hypothetical protein